MSFSVKRHLAENTQLKKYSTQFIMRRISWTEKSTDHCRNHFCLLWFVNKTISVSQQFFLKFVFIIFYDYSIIFWNMDLENTNLDRINDILSLIKDDLLHKEYLRSKSINTYLIFAWPSFFLFSKWFRIFIFSKYLLKSKPFQWAANHLFLRFPPIGLYFHRKQQISKSLIFYLF